MSIDDLFAKKTNKSSRKANDPLKEPGVKKARLTSADEVAYARLSHTPVASPDILTSQLQGKSRFYIEFIRLRDNLVCGQLFGQGEVHQNSRPEDYGDI
jgi:hypothetical protein